jgi:hypothetical protein
VSHGALDSLVELRRRQRPESTCVARLVALPDACQMDGTELAQKQSQQWLSTDPVPRENLVGSSRSVRRALHGDERFSHARARMSITSHPATA